jgi:hypothetical protein
MSIFAKNAGIMVNVRIPGLGERFFGYYRKRAKR